MENEIVLLANGYNGHPELVPFSIICNYLIWLSYYLIGGYGVFMGIKSIKYHVDIKLPRSPWFWAHAGLFLVLSGTEHLLENFHVSRTFFPLIAGSRPIDAAHIALVTKFFTAVISVSFGIRMMIQSDYKDLMRQHAAEMDEIKTGLFKTDIINQIPGLVFLVNTYGQFVDANEHACRVLGYKRGELKGVNFFTILAPEYVAGTRKAYRYPELMEDFHFAFNEYMKKHGGNQGMYWINDSTVRSDGEYYVAHAVTGMDVIDLKDL